MVSKTRHIAGFFYICCLWMIEPFVWQTYALNPYVKLSVSCV
ncbi:hypothetical protein VRK_24830 [Vibrio sp. MEBiC08052]|nr:hypothetical protein VRK_24830 [Vibrio sp. MEBiC08052]